MIEAALIFFICIIDLFIGFTAGCVVTYYLMRDRDE